MKELEPNIFYSDRVRDYSRKVVMENRDIVTIDDKSVENELVGNLSEFKNLLKESDDPFATDELSPENELGLSLFLDVVNFCYCNPYSKRDYIYIDMRGKSIGRARGLKAAMTEAEVNWGSTREVSKISPTEWSKMIQLGSNKDFYLGEDRGKRISEFAGKLFQSGFKNISHFLTFAEFNTEYLLPVLDKSGYFDDEFQKRSQLAISMMNGVLKRRFDKEFKGLDTLTIMADYRLPQVMYNFGAIKLPEELKDKLMKQEIIESGSPTEISLRAASVVVGEKVSKLMDINESEVDSLLWTLSQKMSDEKKLTIPHMLVATDKY